MTFLAVAPWLAWTIVAAAVASTVGVFLIRPRRPTVVVSSLVIWRRVLDRTRPQSLWSRLRWIVSLLTAVCVAAGMALALAGPVAGGAGNSARRTLVVLDASWSMRARTSAGDSRWDRAKARAAALVTAAGGEVALATTADGIVAGPTTDRAIISAALAGLQPSAGGDGAWPAIAGADDVHFITDGTVPHSSPAGTRVHSVFEPAPNVAVTAFEVLPAADDPDLAEVFLAITNHAEKRQPAQVNVTRASTVVMSRSIDLAAGAVHREMLTVSRDGDARFRVHVSARDNAVDVDDDAAAWLPTAEPLQVAAVGPGSPMPAVLAADATLRVLAVDPAAYEEARADVWVFDRWLPPQAPTAPALILDPPASAWLGPRGGEERAPVWQRPPTHDLFTGVDTMFLQVGMAHTVRRSSLVPVATSVARTPLVSVEDGAMGRFVVVGFSTSDSNLASTPAFPVFVGNAIDWLGRPERGRRRQPGPIVLPATTRRVIAPDGRPVPTVARDGRVTARLDTPGLYLVEWAGTPRVVRVSLDDPRRSNVWTTTIAAGADGAGGGSPVGQPWTRPIAAVVAVLVGLEWLTWRRRLTV